MKKLAWGALLVGLIACKNDNPTQDGVGLLDAPPVDTIGVCNPLTQTGCNAGEKCTWIQDQEEPPIGHVGCAPEAAAPKAIDAACTTPPAGPTGYDDCEKGAVCLSGVCKQICDVNGGAPTCDENHSCTRYADFFEIGGDAVAGVCDPGCDPLTQDLKVGTNKTACGSPTANMPNSGCYGFDDYSCAPVSAQTLTLLDRDRPQTNAAGNPYLNGCAPGFIPFFYEMTGSTTTLCSGYCSALEIDNTAAHSGNNQGNAAALAKMPTDATAVAGHGVCSALYKGSSASSSCRFIYPYLQDESTGELPLAFEESVYLDTLGICFEYTQFNYDHDMNTQTANLPYPNCAQLPPRGVGTPDPNHGDAADWGCQKLSNSAPLPAFAESGKSQFNAALKQVRLPKQAPMELVRHRFN